MKALMNSQKICIFVVLGFLLSTGNICLAQSVQPPHGEKDKAKFIKNRIIIKFKSEGDKAVEQEIEQIIKNKESLRGVLRDKSDSLDKLNKKFKVRQARRMFQKEKGLSLADEKQQRKLERQKIKSMFQSRSRRAKDSLETDLSNIYVMEVEEGQDVDQMVKEFQSDPHVDFVQPDFIMEANFVPNDPYYSGGNLWGLNKIQMPTAWDKSQGEGVVVAVVDTGVDYNHPDLSANIWRNVGEISDNGIDDDHNGYIDDVRGFDFTTCLRYDNGTCVAKVKDNDPMDVYGHGTHVAGTIGAVGNNNQGVIGVAPRVRIMPLKGLSDSGSGSISGLAEAIVYAAHNGADVISNSWGCANCPVNVLAENAVREAVSLGSLVVFSAGNSNTDVMTTSPANMKEVVAVSAADGADNRASFSNFGAMVDVAAPGVNITSTYPGNRYATMSGTSMAAPHVAGEAALILSRHPEFTNDQVQQVLRGSLDRMDYLSRYPYFGSGRLNASTAADYNSTLNVNITDPANNETVKSSSYVVISGNANGANFKNYQLFYMLDQVNQVWTPVEGLISRPVANNILGTMDVRNLPLGKYLLRLEAEAANGQLFNDVLSFVLEGADQPPVMAPIGNKTVTATQPLKIDITVSDANLTDTIFIFAEYPSGTFGGSFVDNRNRTATFNWTPAANQIGDFKVKFTANDGHTSVYELVTIHVVGNRPPVLDPIGNKSAVPGQILSFNIHATDPDLNPVSLLAEFPLGTFGANFTDQGNGTGVFTWTPTASQLGNFQVNFKASDGQTFSSELISINVADPSQAINLVDNGNFSPSLSKSFWSGWGSSVLLATDTGNIAPNSAKIKAGTFKRNLYHSLINVSAGNTYQFKYALKSTLTAGSANVIIEWRNKNGFLISTQVLKTIITAQGWTVLTHDVVPPLNAVKVKIVFETLGKSAGEIFIDDVSLQ